MKTKGELIENLPKFIFLVIVIAVLLIFVGTLVANTFKSSGDKETVKQWVWQHSLKEKYTGHLLGKIDYPPIDSLSKPLEINTVQELNSDAVRQDLAESVYDCGDAFYFGQEKYQFLSAFQVAQDGYVFCFPCRKIDFGEDIEGKNLKLTGFFNYMQTRSPFSTGSPTYAQIINKMNPKLFNTEISPAQDVILTNNDKYIFFLSTYKIDSNRGGCVAKDFLSKDVGLGDTVGGAIVVGLDTVTGVVDSVKAFFGINVDKQSSMIAIGDAALMSRVCNSVPPKIGCDPKTWAYETAANMYPVGI